MNYVERIQVSLRTALQFLGQLLAFLLCNVVALLPALAALVLFRPVGGILDWVGIFPDTQIWTSGDIAVLAGLTAIVVLAAINTLPKDTEPCFWLPYAMGTLWVLAFVLMYRDAMMFAWVELAILLVLHVVHVRWTWLHPLPLHQEHSTETVFRKTPMPAPDPVQPTHPQRPAENAAPALQFVSRTARYGRGDILGMDSVVN